MESMAKSKLLSIPVKDITKSFVEDMFASYYDKETKQSKQSNFVPTEEITLTHQEYPFVKDKVDTTTGM